MSDAATIAIVRRIRGRLEDVARSAVGRYRDEIVDYASTSDDFLFGEVLDIARHNFEALLHNLESGKDLDSEQLAPTRVGAARRVHQGVSLASLQHAYRLFGEEIWHVIVGEARLDVPEEREAALQASSYVMRHVTLITMAGSQAYLDEAEGVWSDREVVRRDLLEAMLTGRGDLDATRVMARTVGVQLVDDYAVVVGRAATSSRMTLRHAIDTARQHLRAVGPVLLGLRERELIGFCPAPAITDMDRVKAAAGALATALAGDAIVFGVGGWHPGAAGVPAAYAEAREAVAIALRAGVRGRAVSFDEVLIEHILRSSPHAGRLLRDALGPLEEYDARRGAALVATLHAYLETGFSVTRSAARLHVHPNTVVYRLGRIEALTGRDPRNADDLLFLALGLKLAAPP